MRQIGSCLLAICILINLGACIKEEIPEDVIQPEQMKVLLKEFHLANALAQRIGKSIEDRTAERQELFSAILEREGETRENFHKSYLFYLDHPKFMNEIYDQIVEEFNEEVTIEEDFRFNKMRERKDAYVSKLDQQADSTEKQKL